MFEYPASTLTCPSAVRLRFRAPRAVGIIRVYIYVYKYLFVTRIYMPAMYNAHRPRGPRSTRAVSALFEFLFLSNRV